ncbi:MAG: class I SAM-dependent methyltransferase [Candidatus Gracilibacteria bacterium]
MKPYEKLASLYQQNWGTFSLGYLKLLDHISRKFKFYPSTILDIACGTGNLLSKLHKQGFKVVGSDISPEMISVAKIKNPSIEWKIIDMSKLNLKRTFDLILCPFDSLNYLLNDKQVDSTFSKVYKHLNKNGFFIFDINTPNLYEAKHHGIIKREVNGVKFKQILKYDCVKQLASTTFEFGTDENEKHIQKAYPKDGITKKLIFHKFKILDTYADLKFNKVKKLSERIFFIAQK